MTLGLKENFLKSCLVAIGVQEDFMFISSGFINCRNGRKIFKYIGLPMGDELHKYYLTSSGKGSSKEIKIMGNCVYISLVGKIVWNNFLLSVILIFNLSYMKMPNKVWREVVKIQRVFS